ncbi:MAG: hypothetical protein M1147_05630 [Nitrospirae bacterium]|nr:hypothetical protein [Nitrospirota bacterium]MCL5977598.1 hypothetical protein [Nitrospirota bacterium]
MSFLILALTLTNAQASGFINTVSSKKIMVVFTESSEYTAYAESLIKEMLQKKGCKLVDPEMVEKVKKHKYLWEAINNDAIAMAKIMTDMTEFDAEILIKGTLIVESHQRFATQYEGSASLSMRFLDTKTGRELFSVQSDPLGSTENPMPVESSPLAAKQVAIKKVIENAALRLGLTSSEDVYGKATFSPKFYKTLHSNDRIKKVVFSPDSKDIAIISDYSVSIVEIHSGRQTVRYEVADEITSISFNKHGELIAIGTDSRHVYIYERKSNLLRKKYSGHGSSVTSLVFSNEGSLLAAGFKDGHIELIDVSRGEKAGHLSGHSKSVHSLAFTPNDRFLVSFSEDLLTKFWDVNVKRETRSFKEPMDRLFFACLSVDGSLMGLNTKDIAIDLLRNRRTDNRFLIIRNTSTGEEVRRFNLSKDISAIAFYLNKRYIASASEDNTVRIWDINTGAEITVLSLERPAVSLDFSNDGKMLVYAYDTTVTVVRL